MQQKELTDRARLLTVVAKHADKVNKSIAQLSREAGVNKMTLYNLRVGGVSMRTVRAYASVMGMSAAEVVRQMDEVTT